MEKSIIKTIFSIIILIVVLFLIYVFIVDYPVIIGTFLGIIFPQTHTVYLVEINKHADLGNVTLTYISDDDFKKSPELRELFDNVVPIDDENFSGNTQIVKSISVSESKISKLKEEYASKTFYWKKGYYGILIPGSTTPKV